MRLLNGSYTITCGAQKELRICTVKSRAHLNSNSSGTLYFHASAPFHCLMVFTAAFHKETTKKKKKNCSHVPKPQSDYKACHSGEPRRVLQHAPKSEYMTMFAICLHENEPFSSAAPKPLTRVRAERKVPRNLCSSR